MGGWEDAHQRVRNASLVSVGLRAWTLGLKLSSRPPIWPGDQPAC